MKRLTVVFMAVAAFILLVAGAAQAAPGLQAFGTGDVAVTHADSATIVNDAGEYGGVYVSGRKDLSGKPLSAVDFSFTSTGSTAGGAPRFSIPIDNAAIDGPKDWTFSYGKDVAYAFLDVANCGGSGVVSTELSTCPVFLNAGGSWANWDAFAEANPTYRIANVARAFVIADQEGTYNVSNIVLR
jgi:hypothetical protein